VYHMASATCIECAHPSRATVKVNSSTLITFGAAAWSRTLRIRRDGGPPFLIAVSLTGPRVCPIRCGLRDGGGVPASASDRPIVPGTGSREKDQRSLKRATNGAISY
jgi:hypothetical protein